MIYKVTILVLCLVSIVIISNASAEQVVIYDDFSEPFLNTTKWTESTDSALYPSEHYVNVSEGRFHILQNTTEDSVHFLKMERELKTDEILEYDLIYNSGIGNNIHFVIINNFGWGDLMTPQCLNCYIGFWNYAGLGGTEFGIYNVRMKIENISLILSVQQPNGSYWNQTFSLSKTNPPYYVTFVSGTGHNGLMHFDYDNFIITTNESPPEPNETCNCSELKERIEILESNVTELKSRIEAVEILVVTIQNSINLVQQALEQFTSLILGYLSNAPYSTKKSMVCGYMKDNNLTNYSALGIECQIKNWSPKKPFVESAHCKCSK